jgi:ABC-type multidrug transport system ATPase subunit
MLYYMLLLINAKVSGIAKSNEVLAIMGASGAGKKCLIKINFNRRSIYSDRIFVRQDNFTECFELSEQRRLVHRGRR